MYNPRDLVNWFFSKCVDKWSSSARRYFEVVGISSVIRIGLFYLRRSVVVPFV